jgi:hypothetical protein
VNTARFSFSDRGWFQYDPSLGSKLVNRLRQTSQKPTSGQLGEEGRRVRYLGIGMDHIKTFANQAEAPICI